MRGERPVREGDTWYNLRSGRVCVVKMYRHGVVTYRYVDGNRPQWMLTKQFVEAFDKQ